MMDKLTYPKTLCHLHGLVCAAIIDYEHVDRVDTVYRFGDRLQDQWKSRLLIETRDHNDKFHIVEDISWPVDRDSTGSLFVVQARRMPHHPSTPSRAVRPRDSAKPTAFGADIRPRRLGPGEVAVSSLGPVCADRLADRKRVASTRARAVQRLPPAG